MIWIYVLLSFAVGRDPISKDPADPDTEDVVDSTAGFCRLRSVCDVSLWESIGGP